jgi:abortive infection bacteriophage resistance protein
MSKLAFSEPVLSVPEQRADLQARGLVISDPARAERTLQYLGYHRLLDYAQAFIDSLDKNQRFLPQTRFEDVLALHEFDAQLHSLIWEALSSLEITLMTLIPRAMALEYGEYWYLASVHFSSEEEHADLLEHIREKTSKRKRTSAKEGNAVAIQIELGSEVLTVRLFLKTWAWMFKALTSLEKKRVAKALKLKPVLLESWLENLVYLKELINRQARCWDRHFEISPLAQVADQLYFSPKHSLYAQLSMMQTGMRLWIQDESWSKKLKALLDTNRHIPIQRMGFPDNWAQDGLWI